MTDVPKPDPSLFRRKWSNDEPAPPPVVPPPDVPMRPAAEQELAARSLKALLGKIPAEWTWSATYAHGFELVKHRIDGTVVTEIEHAATVAVKLQAPDNARMVALFVNDAYRDGWTWIKCLDPECPNARFDHPVNPPQKIGYRDLCALLGDPDALAELMSDLT